MKAIDDMSASVRTPGEVGAAIRARRRKLGWDQAELADRIGVSRLWVNQIEAGKPGAKLGLVLQAINALGLTVRVVGPGEPEGQADAASPIEAVDLEVILKAARKKASP